MDSMTEFCPECSKNCRIEQFNFEKICSLCGYIFEKNDLVSENTKVIEEKGFYRRVFHPSQTLFYDQEKNELKRKKKLIEMLNLCSSFLNMTNVFLKI
jgi:hypothetical protein